MRQRRKLYILFIILILTLCFVGCSQNIDTADYPNNIYSFTDDIGNTVVLTNKPERVAVLFSSYAEIWQLAGGRVDITVAESIERSFADKDAIIVDDKSGHTSIDTEALIACEPDLVIGTADHEVQTQTAAICKEAGIPCALFKVETAEDYLRVLEIFTDILDTPDNYNEYGTKVKENITALLENVGPQADTTDILFIRSGSSARSAKAKTADENFVCRMLNDLGTHNIADEAEILLEGLSLEEIIIRDPDIIFITTMGDEAAATEYMTSLLKSEAWSELTAVKNGNYHFLPKDMFHYKPNARWYDAYLYLADIIYPEL